MQPHTGSLDPISLVAYFNPPFYAPDIEMVWVDRLSHILATHLGVV